MIERDARNRGIAAMGVAAGVGFIAVVAFPAYVVLVLATSVRDDFGRAILAAFVLYVAAPPAIAMGIIGRAVGGRRGEAWRPSAPFEPDNWTSPDTADVQRVVAGRFSKPEADSN